MTRGLTTVAKRGTKETSTSTARRPTVVEEASTSHTTDDSDYDADLEMRRNTAEPSTSQEDLHPQRRPRQKRKRQQQTHVPEATDTKGQLAMESQYVLATLKANRTQVANVNCRVDHTGHLIASLSGRKREIAEEMGFSSLKHLNERVLPRELCYWLMTRIDPDTGVLLATDGREFLLAPVHVHCILGIPRGDKDVPESFTSPGQKRVERIIWEDFGATIDGKKQISMDKALYVVKEGDGELDETRFKRALLIAILGSFLCPTTNFASLAVELLPALLTTEDACSSYDWCTYVLSWLLRRARVFNLKFNRQGYVAGCGGCTYFSARALMAINTIVFYLDRLNTRPTSWGVYPRVKAWTQGALKLATKEDRVCEDDDYGKSTTLDVAYGESHPKAPRDFYPLPHSAGGLADEIKITAILKRVVKEAMREVMAEERATVGLTSLRNEEHRPTPSTPSSTHRSPTPSQVRWADFVNTLSSSPVRQPTPVREPTPVRGQACSQSQQPTPVREQACSQGEQGGAFVPTSATHGAGVVSDQGEAQLEEQQIPLDTPLANLLPPRDHTVKNVYKTRSNAKRATKSSAAVAQEYDTTHAAARKHLSQHEKNLLAFIRRWGSQKRKSSAEVTVEDHVLAKCGTVVAHHSSCYSALASTAMLDSGYVRWAAALYTKRWMIQFKDHSRRIMLDPYVGGQLVTKSGSTDAFLNKWSSSFPSESKTIGIIFVPFVFLEHWICLALSVRDKTIWVMDSLYNDPITTHKSAIANLIEGIDGLLKRADDSWTEGVIAQWPLQSVAMQQGDHRCCGVMMLCCIKACAERMRKDFKVDAVGKAREQLILEDVFSDLNEHRESLIKLAC